MRRGQSSGLKSASHMTSSNGALGGSKSHQAALYRSSDRNGRHADISPAHSVTGSHRGSHNNSPHVQGPTAYDDPHRTSGGIIGGGGSGRASPHHHRGSSPLGTGSGRDGGTHSSSGVPSGQRRGKSRAGRQAQRASRHQRGSGTGPGGGAGGGAGGDTTPSGTDAETDADAGYAAAGSPHGDRNGGGPGIAAGPSGRSALASATTSGRGARVSLGGGIVGLDYGGGGSSGGGGGSGGSYRTDGSRASSQDGVGGSGGGEPRSRVSRGGGSRGGSRGASAAGSRRELIPPPPRDAASGHGMAGSSGLPSGSSPRPPPLVVERRSDPRGVIGAIGSGAGGLHAGGSRLGRESGAGISPTATGPSPRVVMAPEALSGPIPELLIHSHGAAGAAVAGGGGSGVHSGANVAYVSDYYPSDTEQVMAEGSYTPAGVYGAAAAAAAAAVAAPGGAGSMRSAIREAASGGSFVGGTSSPRAGGGAAGAAGGVVPQLGGSVSVGGNDIVREHMNAALARMRINNSLPRGAASKPPPLHVQAAMAAAFEKEGPSGLSRDASVTTPNGGNGFAGASAVVSPSGGGAAAAAAVSGAPGRGGSPFGPSSAAMALQMGVVAAPSSPGLGAYASGTQLQQHLGMPPDSPGTSAPSTPISRQISNIGGGGGSGRYDLTLAGRQGSFAAAATTPRGGSRLAGGAAGLDLLPTSRTGSMTAGAVLPLMSTVMLASRKFAAGAARAREGGVASGEMGVAGRMGSITGMPMVREGSFLVSPR
ncbi:hypothetical protein CHLRE_14g628900v5 [Chlamydomonas reinhardtii]|uniref:Uncharacterized protein n=1 Tax=Chlamydomonas reinhardtii TaxID=3055 RepID=A0A2K3CYJ6_CHLRE|nr:uncharacterized protein CHLRE_14g628900v5 [Chlamydomonas reinhardtii]PNW73350.1 hypothetical protein CHLRE_14g628900v5 [Chlamydomonas reinhardtii]